MAFDLVRELNQAVPAMSHPHSPSQFHIKVEQIIYFLVQMPLVTKFAAFYLIFITLSTSWHGPDTSDTKQGDLQITKMLTYALRWPNVFSLNYPPNDQRLLVSWFPGPSKYSKWLPATPRVSTAIRMPQMLKLHLPIYSLSYIILICWLPQWFSSNNCCQPLQSPFSKIHQPPWSQSIHQMSLILPLLQPDDYQYWCRMGAVFKLNYAWWPYG